MSSIGIEKLPKAADETKMEGDLCRADDDPRRSGKAGGTKGGLQGRVPLFPGFQRRPCYKNILGNRTHLSATCQTHPRHGLNIGCEDANFGQSEVALEVVLHYAIDFYSFPPHFLCITDNILLSVRARIRHGESPGTGRDNCTTREQLLAEF